MNIIKISDSIYKFEFPAHTIVEEAILINTWIVLNKGKVYIIDTGFEEMTLEFMKYIDSFGKPEAIFLTHGHRDHILGIKPLIAKYDIKAYLHKEEIKKVKEGHSPYPEKEKNLDHLLSELDINKCSEAGLDIHLTPGHSPGHIIFHHKKDDILLVGDLFTTKENLLLPPIKQYSQSLQTSILSGEIIDKISPKILSSSHGIDISYNYNLYNDFKYYFGE